MVNRYFISYIADKDGTQCLGNTMIKTKVPFDAERDLKDLEEMLEEKYNFKKVVVLYFTKLDGREEL